MYCSKHNRDMLPSKFKEGQFWCPDCHREWKQSQGLKLAVNPLPLQKVDGNVILMDAINEINKRLDTLVAYVIKNLPEKK